MSVVIETTLGDITVDLFLYERPRACLNFLKLCKIKYYNYNLFHTISRGFIAQTGDPTGTRNEGESIFAVIDGPSKKYFEAENEPRIKHTRPGLISFVGGENNMIASQFFLTLGEDLTYLDEKHCVFGEVVEGFEILESINEVICDNDDRPFQDVRITHTAILDDPYPDPKGLRVPSRSPSPSAERLAGGRIAPDEEIDEMTGKSAKEVSEMQAEREAKARATILEMVGDIPDADMAPPENVLFVCKLNPITQDDDLEILFSRFGKIKTCEVIRDRKTGDSLQYAFIEFEDQKSCEDAYFKMDNVLVDDRRLHVDFSQSVSKVRWLGKGKGVINFDDKGNKRKSDINNDIGKGEYKVKNGSRHKNVDKERNNRQNISPRIDTYKSRSPRRKRLSPSSEKSKRKSRSPQPKRTQSRSPKRQRRRSGTPVRSKSPSLRKKYNRSPDYPVRKNDKRTSRSPKRSVSDSRRNIDRYIPERKSGSFRRRSRSPLLANRSPIHNRRNNLYRRHSRSPLRNSGPPQKTRSPARRSSSPGDRRARENMAKYSSDKRFLKERPSISSKFSVPRTERNRQNESPRRSNSPRRRFDSPEEWNVSRRKEERQTRRESPKRAKTSSTNRSEENAESSRGKSSKDKRDVKEMLSSENNISKEKGRTLNQKTKTKVKKAKAGSNKKKISNKHDLSEELDTDNEKKRKTSKKKKHKKKVESSTESSSSEESSSTSSEEEVRKSNKRNIKRVKKEKNKMSSSSSTSSDSTSDSDKSSSSTSSSSSSSSSTSESDNYRKKKLKKKKTKRSSDSD